MTSFIEFLRAEGALAWLPCTILVFAVNCALYRRLNKAPFANPTLLSIAVIGLALISCGVPYRTYLKSVSILDYLLGTAVVALALPLYRNANRLKGRCAQMTAALFCGSLTSIVLGILIAIVAHATSSTILSLAPKSATAAVSLEVSRLIGGEPGVTATLTILTGILGAVAGPYTLNLLRINSPEARGFAMGVASHGIATARAFSEGEVAGSFAGVGMVLNAILTALIVPAAVHAAGYG